MLEGGSYYSHLTEVETEAWDGYDPPMVHTHMQTPKPGSRPLCYNRGPEFSVHDHMQCDYMLEQRSRMTQEVFAHFLISWEGERAA